MIIIITYALPYYETLENILQSAVKTTLPEMYAFAS